MNLSNLFKAAVGSATILGCVIAVFSLFTSAEKEAKLALYSESYTFNVPPHYARMTKSMREYESYMSVYEDLEKIIPKKLKHDDQLKISKFISDKTTKLWSGAYKGGLDSFNGYTYSRIYSTGSLVAKSPILDLPKQAITFVRYPDDSTKEFIGDQRVTLRDLYPDDIVYVWSWYKSSLTPEELNQVRLKHSTGVVTPAYPAQVWGDESKWYAANYKFIKAALFILGYFTLMWFVGFIVDSLSSSNKKESNSESKA
ncbi:hypothetical protein [Shewanella algae]|uniref:hypothetical protein n=1 Tax=Shewanella algae TaxID=38313 RepID=UPI001AAC8CE9|nr:hypothetical protein [Shewanella algae]MBO2592028.1 hypothetical protein [Shewanella algae]MBO2671888.1 hypothetical protein [Shewanella algae]